MKILIVDDEKQLAEALAEILMLHKYSVDCVYNGEDGLSYALSGIYDVIILDIMLPKLSGIEILKRLREKNISSHILMLSAKSEIPDKVLGLNLGADDYLTKPFSSSELVARIGSLLRRPSSYLGNELTYNDLTLSKNSYELKSGKNSIKLGLKEFLIMELFLTNPKIVFSKEMLIEKVWGFDFEGEYNTAEVYISFLRKKLSALNSDVTINSLRGRGYTLGDKDD